MGLQAPVKNGDNIPLYFQTGDGKSDKYIRAIVTDPSGTPITGSPVSLSHVLNGRYENNTLSMPDVAYVRASYEEFDDAAFTLPGFRYTPDTDHFPQDQIQEAIDDLLIATRNVDLEIDVSDNDEIDLAVSDEDEISGEVQDEDSISGTLEDDSISLDVSDDDSELDGEID